MLVSDFGFRISDLPSVFGFQISDFIPSPARDSPPPMIIDLQRFLNSERPTWAELERLLVRLEAEPNERMTLEQLEHFQIGRASCRERV